jgi:hypothetical protein
MDPSTTTTTQLLGMPDSIGDVAQAAAAASSASPSSAPGALSPTTTVLVFVAGLIAFAATTVEFWRRVALQLPFGTGGNNKDQSLLIVIGDDSDRSLSRRRVVGKDAVLVATVVFGVAASQLPWLRS